MDYNNSDGDGGRGGAVLQQRTAMIANDGVGRWLAQLTMTQHGMHSNTKVTDGAPLAGQMLGQYGIRHVAYGTAAIVTGDIISELLNNSTVAGVMAMDKQLLVRHTE